MRSSTASRQVVLAGMLALSVGVAGCGWWRDIDFDRGDLPKLEKKEPRGGPAPMGNIEFQPPIVPIVIQIDSNWQVSVQASKHLVTALGTLSFKGGVAESLKDGSVIPERPADVTQLFVCRADPGGSRCEGFQIDSGRRLKLQMDGGFLQIVERNRVVIEAKAGATLKIEDGGGPTGESKVHGPARRAIEQRTLAVFSTTTEMDLEQSQSGTTADVAYDHITGELKLVNGTQLGWWKRPRIKKEDVPSELSCSQSKEWRDEIPQEYLKEPFMACLKTSEGDLGFFVTWPKDLERSPITLEFYSFVWVR